MTNLKLRLALLLACAGLPAAASGQPAQWLEQGWMPAERTYWHYKSLGQALAPASWCSALERRDTEELFFSRSHMATFGFFHDERNADNPFGLPMGFAVAPPDSPVKGAVGLTCAACHKGQIAYRGKVLRFDGGSSNHDIYAFFGEFFAALAATAGDKAKWERFANRIRAIDGTKDSALRAAVVQMLLDAAWGSEATAKAPGQHVEPGPGRADALNRIGNYVFGQRLREPANYHQNNAPANYPPLWGIWKFNWVHYNASFSQAMARNILQVLGNNGDTHFVDSDGKPTDAETHWKTSVDFKGAAEMEAAYRAVSPPRWPADSLGAIDEAKAAQGRNLFEKLCTSCHAPPPLQRPTTARRSLLSRPFRLRSSARTRPMRRPRICADTISRN